MNRNAGLLWCCLPLFAFAGAGVGCKKKKPTQAEICRKGCEYRLQCVEELALEKAVTAANREHIRRNQEKNHKKFVDYCARRCDAGEARFRHFARCGTESKHCKAYFECESLAPRPFGRNMLID
ncbi:MAG: hypothetical protein ABI333_14255 [bacterium]